ncbi:enoyl-CoA hydratase-related protein [Caballeronia sp. LZ001]|uniref:enoyl-CoA hydratase-related protein n=1 Tax=Caballeronia sp. LZ001 TaxID=3038553 RepID=UPI0028666F42|nr:enoyl-CoA hydratase-related protein [Caballeronia sp. LZ001]MDR5804855.1 enoyl-CoA hydratase-related protein [Caballeronia sp. LZ001]
MEANTSSQQVLVAVDRGVALVTLNRPEVLNAVTRDTIDAIHDVLVRLDEDDQVRAIVVTGAGRAFCAGADLSGSSKWATREGDPASGENVPLDHSSKIPFRLFDMNKPVIGAINGAAVGFGASFLAAMDVRLISDSAKVGFIYARRGICNECCSSFFLPRVVGISRAVEWVASARMLTAAELQEAGFTSAVCTPDELLPRALALGHEIASSTSASAVAISRRLMWRMLSADHPAQAAALEARGLTGLMQLGDPREGAQSFVQKRAPEFKSLPSRDLSFLRTWWQ